MATTENGPEGQHKGRLGNQVYYTLNGKNVTRTIGARTKPSTEKQLRGEMITTMCSKLFPRLLDFLRTGFMAEAIKAKDNAYNQAVKANRAFIFSGDYPHIKIDYEKLLVSKGDLKKAQNWQLTLTSTGLQYTWETDPNMPWPEVNDQVMMLAYFPLQEKVFFTLYGNARSTGTDLLEIPPSLQDKYMETYISFISADRTQIAESIYTGRFNEQPSESADLIS